VSRDPIGERGGANVVAFLDNSPVFGWDALGLYAWPSEQVCVLGVLCAYFNVVGGLPLPLIWDIGQQLEQIRADAHDLATELSQSEAVQEEAPDSWDDAWGVQANLMQALNHCIGACGFARMFAAASPYGEDTAEEIAWKVMACHEGTGFSTAAQTGEIDVDMVRDLFNNAQTVEIAAFSSGLVEGVSPENSCEENCRRMVSAGALVSRGEAQSILQDDPSRVWARLPATFPLFPHRNAWRDLLEQYRQEH